MQDVYFIDEDGRNFSLDELQAEFEELKKSGETETANFEDYIENATGKNGTLTKVVFTKGKVFNF